MMKKECCARMIPLRKLPVTPLPFLETLLEDERMRGLSGRDGIDGKDGERGIDGSDGSNGLDGRDGLPGLDGKHGTDGKDGLNGSDGEAGEHGVDGKDGERGLKGLRGLRGLQGKAGKAGAKGEQGRAPKHQIDTKNGRIRFERPDGSWGGWVEIKQKVTQEVHNSGGGGAKLTHAIVDIENIKGGSLQEYARLAVTTVDLTLTDQHSYVKCKSNAVTITLPPALTYYNATRETSIVYSIANDKSNANNCTLAADGSEKIDDVSSWTIPPGATIKVITDGTEWDIV